MKMAEETQTSSGVQDLIARIRDEGTAYHPFQRKESMP